MKEVVGAKGDERIRSSWQLSSGQPRAWQLRRRACCRAETCSSSNGACLPRPRILTQRNRFIAKRDWIEERILFLASLPEVDAMSTLPPTKSPISDEQLAIWWEEHDLIELQVEEYDMGDLARLKTFALEVSKSRLSNEDTDLIEIALKTLYSLDRLMSRLRDRRSALSFLSYRLQYVLQSLANSVGLTWSRWEAQVSLVQTEQLGARQEFDLLVGKARWTLPPRSTLSISNSSPPPSLPSLTSQPTHAESLALDLCRYKSILDTLHSTLPPSAQLLDKLIEIAPRPLPEAFLDVQDQMEETQTLHERTAGFVEELVQQWRDSDQTHTLAQGVREECERIEAEIQRSLGSLPRRPALLDLGGRIARLREQVGHGERTLVERAMPCHTLVPDQSKHNELLLHTLREELKLATTALDAVELSVDRFRFSLETLERSVALRGEMELTLAGLEEASVALGEMGGSLEWENEEEERYQVILARATGVVELAKPLQLRGATLAVDLTKARLDPTLVRSFRFLSSSFVSQLRTTEGSIRDVERYRGRLSAARALVKGLKKQKEEVRVLRSEMEVAIQEGCWVEGGAIRASGSSALGIRLEGLERQVADTPVDTSSLTDLPPAILSPLLEITASLHEELVVARSSRTTLQQIEAQDQATRSFLVDLSLVSDALHALQARSEVVSALTSEVGALELEQLEQSLLELAGRQSFLNASAHTRIPFIDPSISSVPWSIDAREQNERVRAAVNVAVARGDRLVQVLKESVWATRAGWDNLDREKAEEILRMEEERTELLDTIRREEELKEISAVKQEATRVTEFERALAERDRVEQERLAEDARMESEQVQQEALVIALEKARLEADNGMRYSPERSPFDDIEQDDDVFGRPSQLTSSLSASSIPFPSLNDTTSTPATTFVRLVTDIDAEEVLSRALLPAVVEGTRLESEIATALASYAALSTTERDAVVHSSDELQRKTGLVREVVKLASFKSNVDDADVALSDVVDSLDAVMGVEPTVEGTSLERRSALSVETALAVAETTVAKVGQATLTDQRVARDKERVGGMLNEIREMVEDLARRPPSINSSTSRSSSRLPRASISGTPQRPVSSTPQSKRRASGIPGPTPNFRLHPSRSVNESTPRATKNSMTRSTTFLPTPLRAQGTRSVSSPSTSSFASMSSARQPRASISTAHYTSSIAETGNVYRPNRRRAVDREVARIVNAFAVRTLLESARH